jgi:hypothetical protein
MPQSQSLLALFEARFVFSFPSQCALVRLEASHLPVFSTRPWILLARCFLSSVLPRVGFPYCCDSLCRSLCRRSGVSRPRVAARFPSPPHRADARSSVSCVTARHPAAHFSLHQIWCLCIRFVAGFSSSRLHSK